eukprot:scaffold86302_cov60-Phaeocystis_antarctica.AAC.4
MPTVGAIARYRLVRPLTGPFRKRRRTTSLLLMPRVCICVCTVFMGSRSDACTMPAALLAIAARVGSPDSASDDDDTVRLILAPTCGTVCPAGVATARRTPPSSAGLKTQPAAGSLAAQRDELAAKRLRLSTGSMARAAATRRAHSPLCSQTCGASARDNLRKRVRRLHPSRPCLGNAGGAEPPA